MNKIVIGLVFLGFIITPVAAEEMPPMPEDEVSDEQESESSNQSSEDEGESQDAEESEETGIVYSLIQNIFTLFE